MPVLFWHESFFFFLSFFSCLLVKNLGGVKRAETGALISAKATVDVPGCIADAYIQSGCLELGYLHSSAVLDYHSDMQPILAIQSLAHHRRRVSIS